MTTGTLAKLIKAYKEEGYEISVGLNPLREGENGYLNYCGFAYTIESDSIDKSAKIADDYYVGPTRTKTDNSIQYAQNIDLQEKVKRQLKKVSILNKIYNITKTSIFDRFNTSREITSQNIKHPNYIYTGGGICIDEIYFLENILVSLNPKRGFLIGIAAGWSTIAIGLISPSTLLYGIDNLTEGSQAELGFQLTQRIAKNLDINLSICIGSSPQDVSPFLEGIGSLMDFVFVDGLHTNEQVVVDFEAVLPYLADSSIVILHDVLNWNMIEGWHKIAEIADRHNFKCRLLRRTTSGIGVVYRNVSPEVEANIEAFSQSFLCPA